MSTRNKLRWLCATLAPSVVALSACGTSSEGNKGPQGCYDATGNWYYADCSNPVNPVYVGPSATGTMTPPPGPPASNTGVTPTPSGNATNSTGMPNPSASGVGPTPTGTGAVTPNPSSSTVTPTPTGTDGMVTPMPSDTGSTMPPPVVTVGRTVCTNVPEGLISDFEEGPVTECPEDGACTDTGNVIGQEGWNAKNRWATFYDGTGTKPTAVVETDGTTECDNKVLHVTGSGQTDWGAGVGVSLIQENAAGYAAADEYNATTKFNAIRFRAKSGSSAMTPVRFNFSIPRSEGVDSGGTCDGEVCYNHLGKFLDQEFSLKTDWQEYTLCFDRDFYPLFLPAEPTPEMLSLEERNTFATHILKLQFQFNKQFDHQTAEEFDHATAYDFYLDDVGFVTADCATAPMHSLFTSEASTAKKFPQNAKLGTCDPATDAAKFNAAISYAYERWKANHVTGGYVKTPEVAGANTVSEATGYGMLLAAAMGDKTTFDALWNYAKNGNLVGGLMTWKVPGGQGSATDADTDIAYALKMAAAQWGGTYGGDGDSMAAAAKGADVNGSNQLTNGSNGGVSGFNPSYFAPSFYSAFSGWDAITTANMTLTTSCANQFGSKGLIPDWCGYDGSPKKANDIGAQVTGGFTEAVYGYDAARAPWRLGMAACKGVSGAQALTDKLTGFYNSFGTNGSDIWALLGGYNGAGNPAAGSEDPVGNQMSFIGPAGVAAMASSSGAGVRDRAFRAVLDIMERPEYNHTYYPTTVGLLTLLVMSGNFPHL